MYAKESSKREKGSSAHANGKSRIEFYFLWLLLLVFVIMENDEMRVGMRRNVYKLHTNELVSISFRCTHVLNGCARRMCASDVCAYAETTEWWNRRTKRKRIMHKSVHTFFRSRV